jgi:hypothetical protein
MNLNRDQLFEFNERGYLFLKEEVQVLAEEGPPLYAQRCTDNVREKANENLVRTNFAAHLYSNLPALHDQRRNDPQARQARRVRGG